MFEIGNTLREARLRRRLDILQCEAETKIRAKYLRAMEEEQFDLMPSPTYVRGFLRTYADFLQLDGQLVLDEYESRFGVYDAAAGGDHWRTRRERNGARPGNGGPMRRPVAARPARRAARRSSETRLLWLAIGGVMGVALLVWMGVGGSSDPLNGVSTTPAQPAASGTVAVVDEPVINPDIALREAPVRAASTPVILEGVGEIGSWTQVFSQGPEGRKVWEGMLAPGQTRRFPVRQAIYVVASNPPGLAATIGGEAADLSQGGSWTLTPNGVESGR